MNAAVRSRCAPVRYVWNVLLLVCALIALTSCEGKKRIVYSLEQNDANEILVFLASKGIDAEKEKSAEGGGGGGSKVILWDIVVNASDANEAMRLLNLQGLPRRQGKSVLDIFTSGGGLVSSDLQEKIKYREALAAQLASTIRKYEGILDADVQLSFPEEDPLNPGKSKGKITASIWVKHSGVLDDPNSHLGTKIKRFVASSVTGLNYDDVTLVAVRSRVGESPIEATPLEEEKQLVNVWSLIIAKDSISRFRWIFFSFILLILLLALSLIWLLWKLYPLINSHGGFKSLLSMKPLQIGKKEKIENDTEEIEAKPLEPKKEEKKNIDRDIDET